MLTSQELRTILAGPGDFIRRWRKAHGLTLKQVSERTGITISQLSDIEHGRSDPSVSRLSELVVFMDHYVKR